jgi:hypothetical protein
VSGWAEAVRRAVIAVPPPNDAFDSFMQAAAEVNSLPLESEMLLGLMETTNVWVKRSITEYDK